MKTQRRSVSVTSRAIVDFKVNTWPSHTSNHLSRAALQIAESAFPVNGAVEPSWHLWTDRCGTCRATGSPSLTIPNDPALCESLGPQVASNQRETTWHITW
jgi:hypothetical protein